MGILNSFISSNAVMRVRSAISGAGSSILRAGKRGYGAAAGGMGAARTFGPSVAGLGHLGYAGRMMGRGLSQMGEGMLMGGRQTASGNMALRGGMGMLGSAGRAARRWATAGDFAGTGFTHRGSVMGARLGGAGALGYGAAWGVNRARR